MAHTTRNPESDWKNLKKAEKQWLNDIAEDGCILCHFLELGETPAQIHHVQFVRNAWTNFATVPLCQEHHTGRNGGHGLSRRGFEAKYKLDSIDLIALTIGRLYAKRD